MNIFDHLFVILLAIVVPVMGVISFRRLLRRVAAGENIDRNRLYLNTALGQWALLLLALVGWAFASRPWSAIGFSLDVNGNFIIGATLTLVAIGFLVFQIRQVTTAGKEELCSIRNSFEKLALMMPRNGNELARFYGLSVTAGIVEEILWRGFLFWYLGQFMPLWAAAIVSTIGFGLAHAYQGLARLPAVTLVGSAFAGLYLLTGSVWLPIALHAAVDILQGRMAYEVMQRSQFDDEDIDDAGALIAQ